MPRREDFRLRPVEERDLWQILRWRNSDRIRREMYTDHIITREEHQRWFARVREGKEAGCFVLELKDRPVGVVTVGRIDRKSGVCHWGFYLGETDVPRGTGTALGFLGLETLFETLAFRKVCGEALSTNASSIRFHGRYGFREEGRFIDHVEKEGRYDDVIAFALFRDEWLGRKSSLGKACFEVKDDE